MRSSPGNIALLGLSRDGRLLFVTCGIRSFAYGFLSVILGLYLSEIGLEPGMIGAIFTAALGGGAVMTVILTAVADRVGRRYILVLGAALMALAGSVFALAESRVLLMIAAIVGTISPSGKEVGPFLSVEQAILPQTTSDDNRTGVFAAYNVAGSISGALGAFAVALPALVGLPAVSGYRLLVWSYVGAALLLLVLFTSLTPEIEARPAPRSEARFGLGIDRSSRVVIKLAALFSLDAFAGGFIVQSLVAYWFYLRYGTDLAVLGAIFFGANLLAALSFFFAAPLARRIGLLNTMVFTHLPSNALLLLMPLMPNFELTAAVFLARHLLSQLDVPTRQSYTMAIIAPHERSAAAGIMSVARNAAAAVAPALAGWTLAAPVLGLPFVFSGSLKIIYDLTVYAQFRRLRPPEEIIRRDS